MSFNQGLELKKFEAHWEKLRVEYAAAGMAEDAIQKMYDYDRQQFNAERAHLERTQELSTDTFECSEDENSPLMKRYREVTTVTDTYHETKSSFAWIGEIENERLLSALENLSEDSSYTGYIEFHFEDGSYKRSYYGFKTKKSLQSKKRSKNLLAGTSW